MYNFIEHHPAGLSLYYENIYLPSDTFQTNKRYRIEAYYTSLGNNEVLGNAYSILADVYFRIYKEKIYFSLVVVYHILRNIVQKIIIVILLLVLILMFM